MIGIGIVSYMIYNREREYDTANESYSNMQEEFFVEEPDVQETDVVPENETDQLKVKYKFNYRKMSELNPEVKGYIYLEDSKISYPIVKHSDNEYYLDHDILKNYSVNGAIFIDCGIQNDLHDMNCIIYGHHMNNGSMFGDVSQFINEEFALSHQTFYIYIEDVPHEYRVISSFVCSPSDESVYKKGFSSTQEFVIWAQDMIERSDHNYDEKTVNETDKMVTLSTCTNKGNKRNVTILKQIR